MGSTREILVICHRVEQRAGDLYRLLADAHANVPTISALWRKTAREEDSHANLITQSLRRLTRDRAEIKLTSARAAQILDLIEGALERARQEPPSIAEALEESITLERIMAECHADYALRFDDPERQQLFRAMMAADRDHVGSLEAALEDLRREFGPS